LVARKVGFGSVFASVQHHAVVSSGCSAAASSAHPKLLALRSAEGFAVVPALSLNHSAAQAPNFSFKADGFAAA
jgi:hypothetical protein